MYFIVAGVVVFLGLCVAFWPRPDPLEDTIEWPQDAAGAFLDRTEDSAMGGLQVLYPDTTERANEPTASGLDIYCRIGNRRDVPLRLYLEEEIDKQIISEDRDQTVERWMQRAREHETEKWSFDEPLKIPLFLGGENGIPMTFVSYQRVAGEKSWYGTARILRIGSRLTVLRAEVPSIQRVRSEELLFAPLLRADADFVRKHWEGSSVIPGQPAAKLVASARKELRRDAPSTWAEVLELLVGSLRKAALDDDALVEEEAIVELVKLRRKQALWYNERLLAREKALNAGNIDEAIQVAEPCKMVFGDPNDNRFYEVRKW